MKQKQKKTSSNQIRLYADIILLGAFVLTSIPQVTGIFLHEWISILFIVPILVHLLLDWKWVVNVTKRLFKQLPGAVRFNHIWDLLIFIMMVFVLLTGFLISEAALPALGLHLTIDPFWSAMHHQSVSLLMIMIGVHLAMHWSWIVNMVKRYIRPKPIKLAQPTLQRGK